MNYRKDAEIVIELHRAYQSSRFASAEDLKYDHPWFTGWSPEGGLDRIQYPPATKEDLGKLESTLSVKLPRLLGAYLLGPRCVQMEFERFGLFPNLPGEGLTPIWELMTRDEHLHLPLLERGFIPIGKAADLDYDPLCLNRYARTIDNDFEVVTFDHEEIFCRRRFKPRKVANSFRELITGFIAECQVSK